MPKIFETNDRHKSHIALEYIRGEREGKYLVEVENNKKEITLVEPYPGIENLANKIELAECREDLNETLPFQIWDETRQPNLRDPKLDVELAKDLDAKIAAQVSAQVNAFAELFAAKLADRMKV